MADDDLKREIEALKAQIEALGRSRTTTGDGQTESKASSPDVDEADRFDTLSEDIMGHVHEVVGELGEQLRDANPATLLIVFSLGVLFGRLLPR